MPFIKKIEVNGFKTFGRKTTLLFDRGFTAITGPNGSGKTNIIDAVLFALGEMSARRLRATNFSNLIFHGGLNSNRKKKAKVVIQFDNSDGRLPLDTATDVLFVTLGINPNNYELSTDEVNIIVNYLLSGGKVYMEGGDCWYADPNAGMYTSYFGVNPLVDGGSVTEPFVGVFFTFTYGMSFEYNGENNSLDRIQPNHTDAHTIFRNANYPYAVIFEPGSYYSIASSFEFGGLVDDEFPSTKKELFRRYMEFFS